MKKVIVTLSAILISSTIFAQFGDIFRFNSGGMITVQWNMAKPVGPMSDFVKNTSHTGINIDYRHCYKNNIIIGGRTGWNYFYENKGLSNVEDGTSITYEPLDNKVNIIPLMIVVDYMVNSEKFIPYAGIGIGTYFINTTSSSNNVTSESINSFHFGVSPEVGITIPFIISNFGLNLSTRYNYAIKTGKTDSFSWFDFNIGLSLMY